MFTFLHPPDTIKAERERERERDREIERERERERERGETDQWCSGKNVDKTRKLLYCCMHIKHKGHNSIDFTEYVYTNTHLYISNRPLVNFFSCLSPTMSMKTAVYLVSEIEGHPPFQFMTRSPLNCKTSVEKSML